MSTLTPKQKATLATWGITVDDCGVVTNAAPVGPLDARIAALEAELEQWRDTVTNPQIQAIREDAQKVAERRHAARIAALEAENAAAREREAALAAALPYELQLADPAAILATLRREAKREALEGLKAAAVESIKVTLFESSGRHDGVARDSYCEGVQDVIADLDAALAALDAEEKTS